MPIYRDNATPKIFIDTCSLLSEYADSFWKHLIPVLTNEKANIIVPLRVYEEVEKYANDVELCKRKAPDNPNLNQAAKHAKEKIIKYQAEGIVRVLGDKNDNFYILTFPVDDSHPLTLRVDYTLLSTDGSGETINVHGATAVIPSTYTKWQPNYQRYYRLLYSGSVPHHLRRCRS